jgi:hypothetical protein
MAILATPGRMPVPIFRISWDSPLSDARRVSLFREGENALKTLLEEFPGLRRLRRFRIDLIAAAPIDVTESYQ